MQDMYQVIYIRNDTGAKVVKKTMETNLVISDLYPGAGQVFYFNLYFILLYFF